MFSIPRNAYNIMRGVNISRQVAAGIDYYLCNQHLLKSYTFFERIDLISLYLVSKKPNPLRKFSYSKTCSKFRYQN